MQEKKCNIIQIKGFFFTKMGNLKFDSPNILFILIT